MPNQEGEQPELSPPEDAAALLTRRLTELDNQRGNVSAEQTWQEKASGQPLPPELVLFRRLGEIAQDAAGCDEHTRREFAIVQYACGRAILDELIRQDAELSVIVNRQAGRPDTEPGLASDAQTEVAAALEDQRRQLAAAFPTVTEVPLSARQQRVIAEVIGRVTIRHPQPIETVPLEGTSLSGPLWWPSSRRKQPCCQPDLARPACARSPISGASAPPARVPDASPQLPPFTPVSACDLVLLPPPGAAANLGVGVPVWVGQYQTADG